MDAVPAAVPEPQVADAVPAAVPAAGPAASPDGPVERRVRWPRASRVIPTRYPAVTLFDRVARAEDFDALYALEALTNDRIRAELGQIDAVPADQRIYGEGSGPIMAAFTHINTEGSRFGDGSFGVFYAARDRRTAIAETRHHHARFLAATQQRPMHLPMRLYSVGVDARLVDIRPPGAVPPAVYSPDDYTASQALARRWRGEAAAGVVYRSVRDPSGVCVGLFRPNAAHRCVHAAFLLYAWDGAQIAEVYERIESFHSAPAGVAAA